WARFINRMASRSGSPPTAFTTPPQIAGRGSFVQPKRRAKNKQSRPQDHFNGISGWTRGGARQEIRNRGQQFRRAERRPSFHEIARVAREAGGELRSAPRANTRRGHRVFPAAQGCRQDCRCARVGSRRLISSSSWAERSEVEGSRGVAFR